MRPIIGISCGKAGKHYRASAKVVEVLWEQGGLPFIIPAAADPEEYIDRLQGLIIPGGGDLDPVYYGQDPQRDLGVVEPDRDRLEMGLLKGAIARGIPILGICRGCQLLSVAAGGDLIQDLGEGYHQHRQKAPLSHPSHQINIKAGSLLERLLGPGPLRVNSYHHQGIGRVGSLRPVAWSNDGLIEAIEGDGFILGVQWHPEWLVESAPLFRGFIEAAKERKI
jgi:putative glutamine amidotransferase